MKQPCVYIMANRARGVLYVGVTSDLAKRAWEHRNHTVAGFTRKYNLTRLVWFEPHETMDTALTREKAVKRWHRQWKIEMIEKSNPEWRDLFEDFQP